MADYNQPIIIKKVKKVVHAHHGGAWKIAYADFVTAMMAFFLLLWLISMTTDEQKKGLADYFSPANVSESQSGAGGVLAGTSLDDSGAKQTPTPLQVQEDILSPTTASELASPNPTTGQQNDLSDGENDPLKASASTDLKSTFDQDFHAAAASIRQAWQALPNITDMADNLLVEETENGLNLLIVDQEGRGMFPEGSKYPYEPTRQAIAAIAPILARLPNQVSISGHTAAGSTYDNPRYGPWELSTDRANVVRTILGEFGLPDSRIQSVIGRATTQPIFPNDPYMAANQRIEITVLNEPSPVPPDLEP
jgi:chemotaxis protein MotB